MDNVRYDLVWRRIPRDAYADKFEGRFPDRFSRLASVANWGVLSWLYPHATATKQAHHLGVEHNAGRFLTADSDRLRHRPAFRSAAHILHWGHPPLAYQGAEGLLRAAHVDPRARKLLEKIVDDVVSFAGLSCASAGHAPECAKTSLEGQRFFELYRWLSAWIVSENWSKVWQAILDAENAAGGDPPDESDTKQSLIKTLVCRADRGYDVLSKCNVADFVPRDLLQCGTAWLTLDPDVLWDEDPLGPRAAREWSLIEAARSYLDSRFYSTAESRLLHTLVGRVIANDIAGRKQPFGVGDLRHLLTSGKGDDVLNGYMRPYHRQRLNELRNSALKGSFGAAWYHVGTFGRVSCPDGTAYEIEDFLTGHTGRERLGYPFNKDYSVSIELPELGPFDRSLAGEHRRYASVYCDARQTSTPTLAHPMLTVLAKVFEWTQRERASTVGDALGSWFLDRRVEQRSTRVTNLCGELMAAEAEYFRDALTTLRGAGFSEMSSHGHPGFLIELVDRLGLDGGGAGELVIRLPWRALRSGKGKDLLRRLRSAAATRSASGSGSERGYALELAVACDQLLSPEPCRYRFLVLGATALDDAGSPTSEWDVLRVDLLGDGSWTVTAVEAAVNRTPQKDNEARARLDDLQAKLRSSFGDLAAYRTFLASPASNQPVYEDAGRNWTKS